MFRRNPIISPQNLPIFLKLRPAKEDLKYMQIGYIYRESVSNLDRAPRSEPARFQSQIKRTQFDNSISFLLRESASNPNHLKDPRERLERTLERNQFSQSWMLSITI